MSRVLIIEDEMLIAVTLEPMLEDLGQEVAGIAGASGRGSAVRRNGELRHRDP
jgi:CheY-like chemotaxis protein